MRTSWARPVWLLLAILLALPAPALAACLPEDCIGVEAPATGLMLPGGQAVESARFNVQVHDGLAETRLSITLRQDGPAATVPINLFLPPDAQLLALNVSTFKRTYTAEIVHADDLVIPGTDRPLTMQGPVRIQSATPDQVSLTVELGTTEKATFQAAYLSWIPMVEGQYLYRLGTDRIGSIPALFDATFQLEESAGIGVLRFPALEMGLYYQSADKKSSLAHSEGLQPEELIATWNVVRGPWHGAFFAAPARYNELQREGIASLCHDGREVVDRDVVFVVDRSAATEASLQSIRDGVRAAILRTNTTDQESIILYSQSVIPYRSGLLPSNSQVVSSDRFKVAFIETDPGTVGLPHAAVVEALRQLRESARLQAVDAVQHKEFNPQLNAPLVYWVIGDVPQGYNPDWSLHSIRENNSRIADLVIANLGPDSRYGLLQDLAALNGGVVVDLAGADAVADRLDRLFERAATPQMTDLAVAIQGAKAEGPGLRPVNVDECLRIPVKFSIREDGPLVFNITSRGPFGEGLNHTFGFPLSAIQTIPGLEGLWAQPVLQEDLALGRSQFGELILPSLATKAVAYHQFFLNTTLAIRGDTSSRILAWAPLAHPADESQRIFVVLPTPTGNATGNETGNMTDGNVTGEDDIPVTPTAKDKKSPMPAMVVGLALLALAFRRRA